MAMIAENTEVVAHEQVGSDGHRSAVGWLLYGYQFVVLNIGGSALDEYGCGTWNRVALIIPFDGFDHSDVILRIINVVHSISALNASVFRNQAREVATQRCPVLDVFVVNLGVHRFETKVGCFYRSLIHWLNPPSGFGHLKSSCSETDAVVAENARDFASKEVVVIGLGNVAGFSTLVNHGR